MAIEFLTVEQRRSHGCFNGEPTTDQLARYFHLDDFDRPIVEEHRGDHNRLGFAAQLCTARFLGTFLENLSDTPYGVVAFIGQQLGIRNLAAFEDYCQSVTRKAHPVEIRRRYGFRDFSDISARFRLNRWLYALCWTGTDRPGMLFDRAVAWLITNKVLLPGVHWLSRHCPIPYESAPFEIRLEHPKRIVAAELNITSETLSRTLARLREKQLIRIIGKTILVLNPRRLELTIRQLLGEAL